MLEVIGGVFYLAIGLLWLAGWLIYGIGSLIYRFFAWAGPPVVDWLDESATNSKEQLVDGYHEATSVPRIVDATEATVHEMERVSSAYMREFHAIVRDADEKAKLTTEV